MKIYDYKMVEKFVQKFWNKNKSFKSKDFEKKKKYYCLVMFPYPSGSLHIGHVRNYIIGDVLSRFNRMNKKNVLFPIGWDAFGLPAENAAISNKISPKKWTYNNINYMRKQLKLLGFSFDWDREIITCNKNYYKWEQYFFKYLYKKNVLYKKFSPVNWCNNDKTVLANEQIINNSCWRCNGKISLKYINQWFLKISDYSERLLNDIKYLKNWPKEVKLMQKNWIGKSKWILIEFFLVNLNNIKIIVNFKNINEFLNIEYIILNIKNKISKKIISKIIKDKNYLYKNNIIEHIKKYKYIKTNILSFNSLINKYIPILILDIEYFIYIYKIKYIKFKIIKDVFNINLNYKNINNNDKCIRDIYISDILYSFFCISNIKKKNRIFNIKHVSIKKIFKYKIRDWCISRQRKWGVPIPMAKDSYGKTIAIPNKFIPLKLHNNKKNNLYININNKLVCIEKDTLDTFVQSSWYYIRYTCPKYKKSMVDIKKSNYWLPVDQYIGGIEHSTMHLLYLRFYNKLLRDFNLVKVIEPVNKLLCQGMVLSDTYYYFDKNKKKIWVSYKNVKKIIFNNKIKYFDKNNNEIIYDGLKKMSKSKNNGVNPNEIIEKYGSDVLRSFIIFSAPLKDNLIWKEFNIIGIKRFLNKVWLMVNIHILNNTNNSKFFYYNKKEIIDCTYNIIKSVTYDIKIKQTFNTSISDLMKFTNKIYKIVINKKYDYYFINDLISVLLRILYPFSPHISFFLWNKIGFSNIDYYKWPNKNNYKFNKNNISYIVQINNKFKFIIDIDKNLNKKEIINLIYLSKKFLVYIKNNKVRNIIFVKNKIINFILL